MNFLFVGYATTVPLIRVIFHAVPYVSISSFLNGTYDSGFVSTAWIVGMPVAGDKALHGGLSLDPGTPFDAIKSLLCCTYLHVIQNVEYRKVYLTNIRYTLHLVILM